jgi:hypothetical protein
MFRGESRRTRRRTRRIAVIALATAALAGAAADRATASGVWSTSQTDATPIGSRTFLGQFLNETVTLTVSELGGHSDVTVSFDLYVIQSWDGNGPAGPDVWELSVGGIGPLLHTSFSNVYFEDQSYPGPFPDSSHPAQTGAVEVNTLGYPLYGDSVYHLTFTLPHVESSLSIDFSAFGLASLEDESWGLDNVEVLVDGSRLYFEDFEPPPPANDDIANATVIESLPFTDAVNTSSATTAADDPAGCANTKSVWYRVTPAANERLELNTFGSNYGAEISIWTGAPGSLDLVVCAGSQVFFDATAGTTYYVLVTGGGSLQFTARRAYDLEVGLAEQGSVSNIDGTATMRGSVTCTEPTWVTLTGELRQRAGRFTVIHGTFSQTVLCSGQPTLWSARVVGENGPFSSGRATATADASGCGSVNCDADSATATVRLSAK